MVEESDSKAFITGNELFEKDTMTLTGSSALDSLEYRDVAIFGIGVNFVEDL